jgi:hypothetical protein
MSIRWCGSIRSASCGETPKKFASQPDGPPGRGHLGDAAATVAEQVPVLVGGVAARVPAGQADDRDRLLFAGLGVGELPLRLGKLDGHLLEVFA